MSRTSTTASMPTEQGSLPAVLRWRCWPLVDYARWSWVVLVGILLLGSAIAYIGGWVMCMISSAAIVIAMWQFFVPVEYEIASLGLRRRSLGRTRLLSWHAVRSYQARATGIVLFQRADPIAIDSLRSIFVPYGPDEDETLCVMRQYLPHAVEI